MSEYHAAGSATGAFMIRKGKFKYVHYVGMPPQLFDLEADPYETRDLGQDAGYRGLVADCEAALRKVVESRGGRRAGAQGPGRQDRQARRARGDPGQGQLRLFAGPRHQAGLQLRHLLLRRRSDTLQSSRGLSPGSSRPATPAACCERRGAAVAESACERRHTLRSGRGGPASSAIVGAALAPRASAGWPFPGGNGCEPLAAGRGEPGTRQSM